MPRKSPLSRITSFTHYLLLLTVVTAFREADSIRKDYHPCDPPEITSSRSQWDRIPNNFTLKKSCMRVVIDELCKDNFPDVSVDEIGSDKEFNRGILPCRGANCSIECLHHTYCGEPLTDMDMPTKSIPQQEEAFLQMKMNALPRCNRYLENINETLIMEAGYSCWGQLQCICGMCCESNDQNCFTNSGRLLTPRYHHHHHHYHHRHPLLHPPLLRRPPPPPPLLLPPPPVGRRNMLQALLRLLSRVNLSNTKRTTVMSRMLDQTYKDLQAFITTLSGQRKLRRRPIMGYGTAQRPRVVQYARSNRTITSG